MSKVIIFGNSGSGKSTLAKKISIESGSAHLDLDTIAWQYTSPPTRAAFFESKSKIDSFLKANNSWVVEGCYSDLLQLLMDKADKAIFLNLSVEECFFNAKNRPWEPHKYATLEAQNSNLEMLINWISEYPKREGAFSQKAHFDLFYSFCGVKELRTSNM